MTRRLAQRLPGRITFAARLGDGTVLPAPDRPAHLVRNRAQISTSRPGWTSCAKLPRLSGHLRVRPYRAIAYEPVPLGEYVCESTFTILEEERDRLCKLLCELTQKVKPNGLMCKAVFLVGDPDEQIAK